MAFRKLTLALALSAALGSAFAQSGVEPPEAGAINFKYQVYMRDLDVVSKSLSISADELVLSADIGSTSLAKSVTLTNTGSSSLTIERRFNGSEDFQVTSDCPEQLAPNQSCVASVSFTPAAFGVQQATLEFDSAAGLKSVAVQGRADLLSAKVSSQEGSFIGTVAVGEHVEKQITITNDGTMPIGSIAPQVTLTRGAGLSLATHDCPESLAVDASCTATLLYAPTEVGSVEAIISVSSALASLMSAPLTIRGETLTEIDPYASNVIALFRGEGAAGTTPVDEKGTLTWSLKDLNKPGPVVSQQNAQSGSGSIYIDGVSKNPLITSTNVAFGSSNFTIEFWAWSDPDTTRHSRNNLFRSGPDIVSSWSLNGAHIGYYDSGISLIMANWCVANPGQNCGSYADVINTGTSSIPQKVWTHYALTRQGNVFRSYLNGVKRNEVTAAYSMDAGSDLKLRFAEGYGGYIDDFRVTKGVARYVGNSFTIEKPLRRLK